MRIEATPESARTVICPVATAARIPNADAARIPMFLKNFFGNFDLLLLLATARIPQEILYMKTFGPAG
jgi:hypothetical protein